MLHGPKNPLVQISNRVIEKYNSPNVETVLSSEKIQVRHLVDKNVYKQLIYGGMRFNVSVKGQDLVLEILKLTPSRK